MFARKIICNSAFETEYSSFCELKLLLEISQTTWLEAKKKLEKKMKSRAFSRVHVFFFKAL